MDAIFSTLPPALFVFACAVTLLGGFVKGAVGFAMPLVMISGMGILIDPQIVVACIVIPILIGNGLQVARAGLGPAKDAMREHWRYITQVCVMILISAQFLKSIPTDAMFIVLGVPVVVLCAIQIAGWRPAISQRLRRPFEWVAGTLSGILGGLAGTWGPPTVLYLLALNTPRDRQMAVQGVIYGLGAVALVGAHLASGLLSSQTAPFSLALVVPALLGLWTGGQLLDRIDQKLFRTLTLAVVLIAGANLIRRALLS